MSEVPNPFFASIGSEPCPRCNKPMNQHQHSLPQGCVLVSELEQLLLNFGPKLCGCNEKEIAQRLRESGLLRLLEAGQAMRKMVDYKNFTLKEEDEWDAALAAMKEKIHA